MPVQLISKRFRKIHFILTSIFVVLQQNIQKGSSYKTKDWLTLLFVFMSKIFCLLFHSVTRNTQLLISVSLASAYSSHCPQSLVSHAHFWWSLTKWFNWKPKNKQKNKRARKIAILGTSDLLASAVNRCFSASRCCRLLNFHPSNSTAFTILISTHT